MLVVSDGKLYEKNLQMAGISEDDFRTKLQKAGVHNQKEIFIAFYDEEKRIHVYLNSSRTVPYAAEVML